MRKWSKPGAASAASIRAGRCSCSPTATSISSMKTSSSIRPERLRRSPREGPDGTLSAIAARTTGKINVRIAGRRFRRNFRYSAVAVAGRLATDAVSRHGDAVFIGVLEAAVRRAPGGCLREPSYHGLTNCLLSAIAARTGTLATIFFGRLPTLTAAIPAGTRIARFSSHHLVSLTHL